MCLKLIFRFCIHKVEAAFLSLNSKQLPASGKAFAIFNSINRARSAAVSGDHSGKVDQADTLKLLVFRTTSF